LATDKGFQQLLAVATTIDGPDPSPLGVRPDQVHSGQHFRIFAGELLSLDGEQFLIEGTISLPLTSAPVTSQSQ